MFSLPYSSSSIADLGAKLLRSQSLLDALYEGKDPNRALSKQEQDRAKRNWIGQTVIYKIDKKTYSVVDLVRLHVMML